MRCCLVCLFDLVLLSVTAADFDAGPGSISLTTGKQKLGVTCQFSIDSGGANLTGSPGCHRGEAS